MGCNKMSQPECDESFIDLKCECCGERHESVDYYYSDSPTESKPIKLCVWCHESDYPKWEKEK